VTHGQYKPIQNYTGHDEIRQSAEARGGRNAVVKCMRGMGDDTGILRIDFPGYSGTGLLEKISSEEFFEKFDLQKLALVYQETMGRRVISTRTSAAGVRRAGRAVAVQRANPLATNSGFLESDRRRGATDWEVSQTSRE
jgi:hypothetical protein